MKKVGAHKEGTRVRSTKLEQGGSRVSGGSGNRPARTTDRRSWKRKCTPNQLRNQLEHGWRRYPTSPSGPVVIQPKPKTLKTSWWVGIPPETFYAIARANYERLSADTVSAPGKDVA